MDQAVIVIQQDSDGNFDITKYGEGESLKMATFCIDVLEAAQHEGE